MIVGRFSPAFKITDCDVKMELKPLDEVIPDDDSAGEYTVRLSVRNNLHTIRNLASVGIRLIDCCTPEDEISTILEELYPHIQKIWEHCIKE